MRTAAEILSDLKKRFETRVQDKVASGTVLDFYNVSVSEALSEVYKEIEKNKNPHLWSKLYGESLDDMGVMLNISRKANEDDYTYRYRLMNWVLSNEASNKTAINDALLNPQYASNIEFQPCTKGSGTATCYIIPKDYSLETVTNAMQEAADIVGKIASPVIHIEYVVPTVRAVKFQIYINIAVGMDEDAIKNSIIDEVREYVNKIPPKSYLEIGQINKIGINTPGVEYFSVLSTLVDDEVMDYYKIIQGLDTKFIYDEIIWGEEESETEEDF